ncbi:MAG: FHA domain-containing protein [Flavobacteriales bacterium]|nr:FHA domain-containing protein [Flavobacteriales bacterium]
MAEEVLHVGRSPENNVVIPDPQVSLLHCRIIPLTHASWLIQDLDTPSGTWVNERPVVQKEFGREDRLRLGSVNLDTALLLRFFEYSPRPTGISWNDFRKQEEAIHRFDQLEKVYEQFMEEKKRILKNNLLKSTGIRAGLSAIPIIGAPLSILSTALTGDVQEKLMALEEKFKTEYVCPRCFRFLGEPFANLKKRGYCPGCRTPYVRCPREN